MIITKITKAVKTPGRYNVFVDNEYSFSLNEQQLIELKLKRGQEVNQDTLDQFKNESDFGKNYIRALDLISRRIRSEKEIRDYGWQKRWSSENLEKVVKRLYQNNYLNDEKFARSFIASRSTKNISLRKLKFDLKQKGIKQEIIDSILRDTDSFDEKESLRKLIIKKKIYYKDEKKLISYLTRQGFLYEDINNCMNEIE